VLLRAVVEVLSAQRELSSKDGPGVLTCILLCKPVSSPLSSGSNGVILALQEKESIAKLKQEVCSLNSLLESYANRISILEEQIFEYECAV